MLNIPKAILVALHILEKDGIKAEICQMYGTKDKYFITLPGVDLKETNESTNNQQVQQQKH